ncbi:MAG: hypothetical protein WA383_15745 [Terriglobales bacterium]
MKEILQKLIAILERAHFTDGSVDLSAMLSRWKRPEVPTADDRGVLADIR